jgi:N-acetylglucosaminyldiphosphoundecaprenol N-acetyl-beta-D-mannosaminyltransferase
MKTIHCLGYTIYSDNVLPKHMLSGKTVINTINPHCYCEAKKDPFYSQALINSNILIPDGIGIVLAIKFLTGLKIKRYPGYNLHSHLLQRSNESNARIFYLGSSESTLQKIKKRISTEYPNIEVKSYSPPFQYIFSKEENDQMLSSINEFKPDVLFVGMTAPKQEKWVHQNKNQINAQVIASIGAVFDYYAGTIKRSGKFWIFLGLEWFIRLLIEPKRLWRRYLLSTPRFMWYVILEKFK